MLWFRFLRHTIISSPNFENRLKSSRIVIADCTWSAVGRVTLSSSLSSSFSSSTSNSSSSAPVMSAMMSAVVRRPWDVLTSISKSMKSSVDMVESMWWGNFCFMYEISASRVGIGSSSTSTSLPARLLKGSSSSLMAFWASFWEIPDFRKHYYYVKLTWFSIYLAIPEKLEMTQHPILWRTRVLSPLE